MSHPPAPKGAASAASKSAAAVAAPVATPPAGFVAALVAGATWRLAWRDSRGHRRRLALFVSAIVLGVAALVAIESFGRNVADAIDRQAMSLLGADLQVATRTTFSPAVQAILDAAPGEHAWEDRTATMIYFPATQGSRLVQVRAIEGGFPWYGTLETEPPEAALTFRDAVPVAPAASSEHATTPALPRALVDDSLMLQFDAKVGDTIRLGDASFAITGRLRKVPGEAGFRGAFAPTVFIPRRDLANTHLIKPGSRVFHRAYFHFSDPTGLQPLLDRLTPLKDDERLDIDTVADRKKDLGKSLANLYRFLGLVGFMALLLGGIGVGSSIHVYMREKLASVAVLRCLGATPNQVMAVYVVQTGVMGLLGSLAGAALGVAVQHLLPGLFGGFLPVQLEVAPAWGALAVGVVIGVAVTLAFSMLPMLSLRRTPPLLALRADLEPPPLAWRDPARLAVYAVIALGVFGFAWRQTDSLTRGLGAAGALLGAVVLLVGLAEALMWSVKRWFPRRWPYVWRQGLNNLFRPNNQTVVLMLCLGLGACLIMTLYLCQSSLLQQLARSDRDGRSNIVMFDVQPDQVAGVQALIRSQGLPVVDTVPMISMRIESINGRSVATIRADWAADKEKKDRHWALDREYRSTWRDHLTRSETLIAGEFVPRLGATPIRAGGPGSAPSNEQAKATDSDDITQMASPANSAATPATASGDAYDPTAPDAPPVPVTVEADLAKDLGIAIGDSVMWDVQGVPVDSRVVGLRKVDWMRMETNFFFVFPAGVLDDAPQTNAILSRADTPEASAALQRASVQQFANVSIVDLMLLIDTLDDILDKIAYAIRFMALFSIATGLIVLIGSVSTSRYHLIRESTLLRTLGASRRQIQTILVVEYLFLGSFAAVAGIVLAQGAAWGLVTFAFQADFIWQPWPMVVAWLIVTGLTVLTGVLNNLDILRRPPLAILRAEG